MTDEKITFASDKSLRFVFSDEPQVVVTDLPEFVLRLRAVVEAMDAALELVEVEV